MPSLGWGGCKFFKLLIVIACRLSFHQELLSAVAFNSSPYHYCAVTGDTELAVYLYSKGIEMSSNNITVASFSAAGTGGNTPWKKVISITAHEAALLAGVLQDILEQQSTLSSYGGRMLINPLLVW